MADPVVLDWPFPAGKHVQRSSFYRQDRVAVSDGIFTAVPEVQDFGALWRSEIEMSIADPSDRRAFEQWLRKLRAGVNRVLLYDMDYALSGPVGTGRTYLQGTGAEARQVVFDTNARFSSGAGWAFGLGLRLVLGVTPGDSLALIAGGAPNEDVIGAGDTIGIGADVFFVDDAVRSDNGGRLSIRLSSDHGITAPPGTPVTVGANYLVPMMLTSRQAPRNASGPDRIAAYSLTFQEVPYA